jgi:polar amino acid transport system substrate-binding protein
MKLYLLGAAMTDRQIDALGANRQRLTTLMKSAPGSRLLSDNLFNVPQNIVVPKDKPEVLAAVNAFLDDVRASGFLRDAVAKGGAIGVEAAPKSPGSQHGCPAEPHAASALTPKAARPWTFPRSSRSCRS